MTGPRGTSAALTLESGYPGKADMTFARRLIRDEGGQDLAEYAIALAVITIAVIAAVQLVGTNITSLWNQAATTLQNAAS
jgi:Flp pilus assembly pilin Flp